MDNIKKEYVPPTAEIILLAPYEKLAVNDFRFDDIWGRNNGYFKNTDGTASGIAVTDTFGTKDANGWYGGDGFTFSQKQS